MSPKNWDEGRETSWTWNAKHGEWQLDSCLGAQEMSFPQKKEFNGEGFHGSTFHYSLSCQPSGPDQEFGFEDGDDFGTHASFERKEVDYRSFSQRCSFDDQESPSCRKLSSISQGIMEVVPSTGNVLYDPVTGNVVGERLELPNFGATRDACQGISMDQYGGLGGCLREAVLRRYQTLHDIIEHHELKEESEEHNKGEFIRSMSFKDYGGLEGCLKAASLALRPDGLSEIEGIDVQHRGIETSNDMSKVNKESINMTVSTTTNQQIKENDLASRFGKYGVASHPLTTKLVTLPQSTFEDALKEALRLRSFRIKSRSITPRNYFSRQVTQEDQPTKGK